MFFAVGIARATFSVAGHNPSSNVAGWTEAIPASVSQVTTTVLCVLTPPAGDLELPTWD
ncbi:MAG: hypothetical protein M3Y36_00200 [Actinomycetota bacterium]|nr:hypothetical protein [Actinomycetota bacterium]